MSPHERLLAEQATQAQIDAVAEARRAEKVQLFKNLVYDAREAPDYEQETGILLDAIDVAAELLGVTVDTGR